MRKLKLEIKERFSVNHAGRPAARLFEVSALISTVHLGPVRLPNGHVHRPRRASRGESGATRSQAHNLMAGSDEAITAPQSCPVQEGISHR